MEKVLPLSKKPVLVVTCKRTVYGEELKENANPSCFNRGEIQ
jgi:hypothetical protein